MRWKPSSGEGGDARETPTESGYTRRALLATLGAGTLGAVADDAAGSDSRESAAQGTTTAESEKYEVEWETTLAKADDVRIHDVAPDHAWGCVLAGTLYDSDGELGAWVARVDGDGAVRWTFTEYGVLSSARSIVRGHDGGYVVAGAADEGSVTAGSLVQITGDGSGLGWRRIFDADEEDVRLAGVDRTEDGYAVGGTVGDATGGGVLLAKTGPEGSVTGGSERPDERWLERFDGPQQVVTDVAGMASGDVVAVGYGESDGTTYGAVTGNGFLAIGGYAETYQFGERTRLTGVVSDGAMDHRVVGTTTVDGRDRGTVLHVEGFGDVAERWTFGDDRPLRLFDGVETEAGYVLAGARPLDGEAEADSAGVLLGVDEEGGVRWRRSADPAASPRAWTAAATGAGGRTVLAGLDDHGFDGRAALLEDPPRPDLPTLSSIDPLAGYDPETLTLVGAGVLVDALAIGGGWYAYRRFQGDD